MAFTTPAILLKNLLLSDGKQWNLISTLFASIHVEVFCCFLCSPSQLFIIFNAEGNLTDVVNEFHTFRWIMTDHPTVNCSRTWTKEEFGVEIILIKHLVHSTFLVISQQERVFRAFTFALSDAFVLTKVYENYKRPRKRPHSQLRCFRQFRSTFRFFLQVFLFPSDAIIGSVIIICAKWIIS